MSALLLGSGMFGAWMLIPLLVQQDLQPVPAALRGRDGGGDAAGRPPARHPARSLVPLGDTRERYLDEYEELLGSSALAVHDVVALPTGFSYRFQTATGLSGVLVGVVISSRAELIRR